MRNSKWRAQRRNVGRLRPLLAHECLWTPVLTNQFDQFGVLNVTNHSVSREWVMLAPAKSNPRLLPSLQVPKSRKEGRAAPLLFRLKPPATPFFQKINRQL